MATVTRENIGLLNDKITVNVSKEDYFPAFDKALKNLSKSANIPGFRKGMVPTGMIRKMHGQAVFSDEVLRSIEKELTAYLENENLEIFAQPLPVESNDVQKFDMNNPGDYSFGFEIGLKPEFSIPDLGNETLPLYKVTPTDEAIEEEIERLRLRHGKMSEPETVTGDDDVLNVLFTEIDSEGNNVENGLTKNSSILLKYFSESFRPSLIDKKQDDTIELVFDEAFDGKEKDWIAKDLGLEADGYDKRFSMKINKLEHVERAEFNEEFYKAAYPSKEIASEEDFRKAVIEDISGYWDTQAKNHLQHETFHLLLDKTSMELPETFLKRWMKDFNGDPKTTEQVEGEYEGFAKQLKWTLISDKIVKDNEVVVNPEDIRQLAKNQLLGYMGMSGAEEEQPWMAEYVDRVLKDKKFVEDSYMRIQSDKIFSWAADTVNKQETPISPEDFGKKVQEHQHHEH